jgi:hypothetical protein
VFGWIFLPSLVVFFRFFVEFFLNGVFHIWRDELLHLLQRDSHRVCTGVKAQKFLSAALPPLPENAPKKEGTDNQKNGKPGDGEQSGCKRHGGPHRFGEKSIAHTNRCSPKRSGTFTLQQIQEGLCD